VSIVLYYPNDIYDQRDSGSREKGLKNGVITLVSWTIAPELSESDQRRRLSFCSHHSVDKR